ncbi:MAG: RnfABCDGE type electron transport complex subunit D [Candidatus Sabulitectum sp.]|nr:RnfABCDGE type electron transport complex subunit D [Candidatus Sabulitectum sp.]
MAENRVFDIAVSPHVGSSQNTRRIMWDVVIALTPALIAAFWFFGPRAIMLVAASVGAAVLTEWLCLKFMKRPVNFAFDGSAVVTGLLLAYNVPAGVPWWLPVVGSAFAIAVAKQAFGGLGHNIVNPALLGRAFLVASFPVLMTAGWIAPMQWKDGERIDVQACGVPTAHLMESGELDALSGATPLNALKQTFSWEGEPERSEEVRAMLFSKESIKNLFMGRIGGCIGETSVIMLFLGAIYLILRGVLELRLPLSYLGSVALFGWLFGGQGWFDGNPLFHLLAGGVILGGFFMVTDMVTTPVTKKGRIIFGIGAGLLTMVIRRWGGYPEGCSYSILLMNLGTPLIDRYTKPLSFGEVKKNG